MQSSVTRWAGSGWSGGTPGALTGARGLLAPGDFQFQGEDLGEQVPLGPEAIGVEHGPIERRVGVLQRVLPR